MLHKICKTYIKSKLALKLRKPACIGIFVLELSKVFLVNNDEHKKAKSKNENVVATISHNECKDILLNKKSIRQSMNRIQSKDHRIGPYEFNKI